MTREHLTEVNLGKQLNDDISTYKAHSDCNTLMCFIYDLDGYINNTIGFENDLAKNSTDELKVLVHVFPKH